MMKRILILALFSFVITVIVDCTKEEDVKVISFEKREEAENTVIKPDMKSLRFAVGGMITPREGFGYYKRFLEYIEKKLGMQIDFVDREDYAEINNLLKSGDIDVAFVCGGPYVDGHKEFGIKLLAAPLAYGDTVYYSYIIVHKDSDMKSLEDLRGKKFAFTDPLSNTGKLVPTFILAKMNETPESFFKGHVFTYAHDKSVKVVALGIVDGAAVDSLIWEYANRVNPKYTSRTRIIKKSPPYGIPPLVVRPELDPELTKEIKNIILSAHNDPKGKEILKGMMIQRFVEIQDSAYDSIREMKKWLAENARKS